jgi:hypothetical protein
LDKQKPGLFPITPHCSFRNAQGCRNLRLGGAFEKAHFDNLREPRIHEPELLDGAAESGYFFAFRTAGGAYAIFQLDMNGAAAMDLSGAAADGIDRDIVHNAGRVTKKGLPIGGITAGLGKSECKIHELMRWYRAECRGRNGDEIGRFYGDGGK